MLLQLFDSISKYIYTKISDKAIVKYRNIQGSTNGLLFFLPHINIIDKLKNNSKLFLIADGTPIIFTGCVWDDVSNTVLTDLHIFENCFSDNILTIHVSKTYCMPVSLLSMSELPVDLKLCCIRVAPWQQQL